MDVVCLLSLNDFPARNAIHSFHGIKCKLYLTFKRPEAHVKDLLCSRIIK